MSRHFTGLLLYLTAVFGTISECAHLGYELLLSEPSASSRVCCTRMLQNVCQVNPLGEGTAAHTADSLTLCRPQHLKALTLQLCVG